MSLQIADCRITDTHVYFWNSVFSQWHPCTFADRNMLEYNCAEQYMMAYKARLFNDTIAELRIMESKSPRYQKAMGRQVSNYDDKLWGSIRYEVVVAANYLKFHQNDELKEILRSTGNRTIVEASPDDKIWGIGLAKEDDRVLDESKWEGENLLGKALMEVRRLLFEEE